MGSIEGRHCTSKVLHRSTVGDGREAYEIGLCSNLSRGVDEVWETRRGTERLLRLVGITCYGRSEQLMASIAVRLALQSASRRPVSI
jgi:hypothetical protein